MKTKLTKEQIKKLKKTTKAKKENKNEILKSN